MKEFTCVKMARFLKTYLLHSQIRFKTMKKKKADETIVNHVSLEGVMTFGQLKDGSRIMDFQCFENVEIEPAIVNCKVQIMHDGSVYITQRPKRKRNKALYRDDNSSLTLGHDGRYYFTFSMPVEQAMDLPGSLVIQANNIAEKLMKDLIGNY